MIHIRSKDIHKRCSSENESDDAAKYLDGSLLDLCLIIFFLSLKSSTGYNSKPYSR